MLKNTTHVIGRYGLTELVSIQFTELDVKYIEGRLVFYK
jgi:hypothetical protein